MASQDHFWNTLTALPVADNQIYLEHVNAFAGAFVVPDRRERWRHLLETRPRRISRDSNRLHGALDRRRALRSCELETARLPGSGVYYPFFDVPRIMTAETAGAICGGRDGILSLIPGRLAVYFFHEEEVWLCRL